MNSSDSRDSGASTGRTAPSGALMSALTTEHYALQSARASTIVEANGRSQLFLSAVSGATVALALVAQLDMKGGTFLVFAFTILPALLALGVTSYIRLADLAVHDAYYARAIGRIRSFYLTIEPEARQYWLIKAGDDAHAVMRQAGQRHKRWHHLSHAATAIAAVLAVLAGVLAGLALQTLADPGVGWAGLAGLVAAAAVLTVLLIDQKRRWRHSAQAEPSRFLPDGSRAEPVEQPAGPNRSWTADEQSPRKAFDPAADRLFV
jgi:hypothetical protein